MQRIISPMPSPNGTNHEGLYILRGRKNPRLAFDGRRGRDQSEEPNGEAGQNIKALIEWISQNMQPNDIAKLIVKLHKLAHMNGEPDEAPDLCDLNTDDPEAFPGMPTPGGATTNGKRMSVGDAYRWGLGYGKAFAKALAKKEKKAAKKVAADAKSFAERFPAAARIRPDDGFGRMMNASRPPQREPSEFALRLTNRIKSL